MTSLGSNGKWTAKGCGGLGLTGAWSSNFTGFGLMAGSDRRAYGTGVHRYPLHGGWQMQHAHH